MASSVDSADASSSSTQQQHAHTNRLIHQTSPYLLQHAHNPVEWYPWGDEAFERARAEDRPIFLSVGYSTCYWCHVMERQSFENEAIAKLMNQKFVNIKVDREERPDVDQLYMTAVQVLTRHGGWPMSVWLTPDLRPFYGGTYFPPEDRHGMPGFARLLEGIDAAWRDQRGEINNSADELVRVLRQLAEPPRPRAAVTIDAAFVDQLLDRSTDDYDAALGGFGSAPKFPRETLLELLLAYTAQPAPADDPQSAIQNRKSKILTQVRRTFDAMANGGIRDHLGGGFHRYSTDARWLVPHFEIMLYDNAMLGLVYVEAHRQTGEPRYARVARGIFDFVLREMTSPAGAFYTAFDAEVDAMEGKSYLWTMQQVEEVLGAEDAAIFARVYGLDRGANFVDPHHGSGTPDQNILYLPNGPRQEENPLIVEMRQKLYQARLERKQPLLDTKVITSWNALMIRALALGGRVLNDPRYIEAAKRAAEFLLDHHRLDNGTLLRNTRRLAENDPSCSDSRSATPCAAFLDDYAFLAQALLALHDADGDDRWLTEARGVFTTLRHEFGSNDAGGFYFTAANATDLIVRQKTASDSPLPSGNAVAVMVALELNEPDVARGVLDAFAASLQHAGESMSSMVQAALAYLRTNEPIRVAAPVPGTDESHPGTPADIASRIVDVDVAWLNDRTMSLRLRIEQGYHINARPASAGLTPTEMRVSGAHATLVETIDYPPAIERKFPFAEDPIRVYEGEAVITIRFQSSMRGQGAVRLALQYQACDDRSCLPPITKHAEIATP